MYIPRRDKDLRFFMASRVAMKCKRDGNPRRFVRWAERGKGRDISCCTVLLRGDSAGNSSCRNELAPFISARPRSRTNRREDLGGRRVRERRAAVESRGREIVPRFATATVVAAPRSAVDRRRDDGPPALDHGRSLRMAATYSRRFQRSIRCRDTTRRG
jgi:hypothetical protein